GEPRDPRLAADHRREHPVPGAARRTVSLTQKLVLYALVVALVPLAGTGFSLVRIGEDALRERIQEHQRTAAVAVAGKVAQSVEELGERLSTAIRLTDPLSLKPLERYGMLRILIRQSDDLRAVVLLDREGKALVVPVMRGDLREDIGRLSEN